MQGRALAQAGQPHRAIAELQRAATELGTRALRCATATRRSRSWDGPATGCTGAPGQGANAIGTESLTERELQVARLAVERKTRGLVFMAAVPCRSAHHSFPDSVCLRRPDGHAGACKD